MRLKKYYLYLRDTLAAASLCSRISQYVFVGGALTFFGKFPLITNSAGVGAALRGRLENLITPNAKSECTHSSEPIRKTALRFEIFKNNHRTNGPSVYRMRINKIVRSG